MTITAKVQVGFEFGPGSKPVTESKVFTSQVDFDKFVMLLKEFDAEDEIVSVEFDCR